MKQKNVEAFPNPKNENIIPTKSKYKVKSEEALEIASFNYAALLFSI